MTQIELNDQTKEILGTVCFKAIHVAALMRKAGYEHAPEQKAEAEQAAMIHWQLNLYLKHGDEWRKFGAAQIGEWIKIASKGTTNET